MCPPELSLLFFASSLKEILNTRKSNQKNAYSGTTGLLDILGLSHKLGLGVPKGALRIPGGNPWDPMASYGLPWVRMGIHEFLRVPLGTQEYSYVHMRTHGNPWFPNTWHVACGCIPAMGSYVNPALEQKGSQSGPIALGSPPHWAKGVGMFFVCGASK